MKGEIYKQLLKNSFLNQSQKIDFTNSKCKKILEKLQKHMHLDGFQMKIVVNSCFSVLKLDKVFLFLTFNTLWANPADDKLMIILLFFPEKKGSDISLGDNLWRQFT